MGQKVAPTTRAARPRVASAVGVRALAHDLLAEIAADEDEHWGGGQITASAYETAWVALVRHPEDADRLAFPSTLEWLLRHQRPDGGWGPPFPHSLIPSMAALLALRRAPQQGTSVAEAASRAERYLRRTLRRWRAEQIDTPFFEFLVPALHDELESLGIHLRFPDVELMSARRQAKLAHLPLDSLYAGESTLAHVLEVFGPALDFARLRAVRADNGSYGYSPSATAAVLRYAPVWDSAACGWLFRLATRAEEAGDPGGMPVSHPADTFEAAWVLHLLHSGGLPLEPAADPALRRLLLWLHGCLTPSGATFSRTRGLPPDADDTALVLAVLNQHGVRADVSALWPFERDNHFVSYDGERTTSTSANAHALEALLSVDAIGLPDLAARRRKLVHYLLAERCPDGYWTDKWHLSPYYATLSCVLALARVPDADLRAERELGATVEWLAATQRADGGWGDVRATLEETAYATLTLATLLRLRPSLHLPTRARMVRRGRAYLRRRLAALQTPNELPALWVDKTLYVPPRVLRAAVLAALYSDQEGEVAVTTYERPLADA